MFWTGNEISDNTVKPFHTLFKYDLLKMHTLPIHMIIVESVDNGRIRFYVIEIGTLKEMKVFKKNVIK